MTLSRAGIDQLQWESLYHGFDTGAEFLHCSNDACAWVRGILQERDALAEQIEDLRRELLG